MKVKLHRGPLIPIEAFLSWDKDQQEAWIKRAAAENQETVYVSEHWADILVIMMVVLTLVALFTGRIPSVP